MPEQNPAAAPGDPGQAPDSSVPGAAMDGYTKETHSFMNREVNAAHDAQRLAEARAEELQQKYDEASWFQEQMTGMVEDQRFAPYVQAYMSGQDPQAGPATPPPAQNGPPMQQVPGQTAPTHADGTPLTRNEVLQMFKQFGQGLEQTYGGHIAKLNNLTFNRESASLIEKFGADVVGKHKEALRNTLVQNPNLGLERAFRLVAYEDIEAQAAAKGRELGRRDASFMTEPPSGGSSVIKPEVDPRVTEAQKMMTSGRPEDRENATRMIVQANLEKQMRGGD